MCPKSFFTPELSLPEGSESRISARWCLQLGDLGNLGRLRVAGMLHPSLIGCHFWRAEHTPAAYNPPMALQSPVSLSFQGLYRNFGRLAVLRDISGSVSAGEILLVTGANGSGKSTLLKCLAGLLAPDLGSIKYWEVGQEFTTAERRLRLGYAAPDLSFYDELTAEENLDFFARMRRCPTQRPRELLDRVDLPGGRMGHALSSGMRQRLRWCWALLHRPRLLLLDEPFQNLDEPGCRAATQLLEEHLANGAAVVANPGALDLPYVTRHLNLDN